MRKPIFHFFALLFLVACLQAQAEGAERPTSLTISPQDLALLVGEWEGSLTYIDYSSGKPYTMPADMSILAGKNELRLKVLNIYPNEPKANGKSKFSISKDGSSINGRQIVYRNDLPNGDIEFQVEYSGKDGNENRKATIRETYIISQSVFFNKKEVQFLGKTDWIRRNESTYNKKQ